MKNWILSYVNVNWISNSLKYPIPCNRFLATEIKVSKKSRYQKKLKIFKKEAPTLVGRVKLFMKIIDL